MRSPSEALLVIDMQPDFMKGGPLAVPGAEELVAPIGKLMEDYHHVIVTQDWHPKGHVSFASSHKDRKPFEIIPLYAKEQTLWPDHCIQGTKGAQIHPGIPLDLATLILRKGTRQDTDSYSAFEENWGPDRRRHSTGLMGMLFERVIRKIDVVGVERRHCVLWSCLSIGMAIPTRVIWPLTAALDPAYDEEVKLALGKVSVGIDTDYWKG